MAEVDSPPSYASSLEDDSDAVNTDSARVYFGPLQSPEKKFAHHAKLRTPLRRSTRLSNIPVNKPLSPRGLEEDEELRSDEGSGDSPAPEQSAATANALILEVASSSTDFVEISEPHQAFVAPAESTVAQPSAVSAVLPHDLDTDICAVGDQRVEEASTEGDLRGVVSREGTPVIDAAPPDEPSSLLATRILRAQDNPSPPPSLEDIERARSTSLRALPSVAENASQQDLIRFDSFLAPASPRPIHAYQNPSAHPTLATVDDLLSLSPACDAATTKPNQQQTAVDDEDQVLLELSHEDPEPPSFLQENLLIPELVSNLPASVRRSLRRRRSRSPLALDVVSSTDISRPHSDPVNSSQLVQTGNSREATPDDGERRESKLNLETKLSETPLVKTVLSNRPSLERTSSESVTTDSNAIKGDEGDARSGTEGKRQGDEGETRTLFARELGSLSPMSAGLLMQLIPISSRSHNEDSAPVEPPSTPPRDGPADSPVSLSPSPLRTPARRIPIAQAVAQGVVSVQKVGSSSNTLFPKATAGAGFLSSPVFKRPALDDPTRSPAKRIPITEAMFMTSPRKGKAPTGSGSPIRTFSRDRSRSVEPKPPVFRRERSGSAEPTRPIPVKVGKDGFFTRPPSSAPNSKTPSNNLPTSISSRLDKQRTALPFPIIASRVQPTIPEAEEKGVEPPSSSVPRPSPALASSPKLSPSKPGLSLRQPSTCSRIPRIGVKPYARPKAIGLPSVTDPKMPIPMRRAVGANGNASTVGSSTCTTQPLRVMRIAHGSGSGAEDKVISKTISSPSIKGPDATIFKSETTTSTTLLKRKRDGERPKPLSSDEPIVIRKVVPGMFGQTSKPALSPAVSIPPIEQPLTVPSPIKEQAPTKMRRVMDWKKPPQVTSAAGGSTVETKTQEEVLEPQQLPTDSEGQKGVQHELPQSSPCSSPAPEAGHSIISSPSTPSRKSIATPAEPPPDPQGESSAISDTRRSTRSRRHTEPNSDVLGASPPIVRPLQLRRKRPVAAESSTYAGMTALALKTLTTTNTARNQQQVVALHTEVIRKEGVRPESPTTKVRTILERQKTLKVQERKERAERRARRSAGETADVDSSSDAGDLSIMSLDIDGIPPRHRRGPGDEEDYETPERPAKRGKTEAGEDTKEEDEKRVRWDRGLATTAYLDDSPLQLRRPPKAENAVKGCLTNAAKAVRLDTLGNVLNADVPLADLVHENIIVKKFVYDDDPAVNIPPQTPPPALPAKVTRSKSKKSKS